MHLDEYRNKFPRDKGRNHHEYNRESRKDWIERTIIELKCRTDLDEVTETILTILEVMNNEE